MSEEKKLKEKELEKVNGGRSVDPLLNENDNTNMPSSSEGGGFVGMVNNNDMLIGIVQSDTQQME